MFRCFLHDKSWLALSSCYKIVGKKCIKMFVASSKEKNCRDNCNELSCKKLQKITKEFAPYIMLLQSSFEMVWKQMV